jgi:hypothetical protein
MQGLSRSVYTTDGPNPDVEAQGLRRARSENWLMALPPDPGTNGSSARGKRHAWVVAAALVLVLAIGLPVVATRGGSGSQDVGVTNQPLPSTRQGTTPQSQPYKLGHPVTTNDGVYTYTSSSTTTPLTP